MPMRIQVVDRDNLHKGHFRNETPYLLLAVYDPDKRPPRLDKGDNNCRGYAAFPFWDVVNGDNRAKPEYMTPHMAAVYAALLVGNSDPNALSVVCADENGIHRSAGLAAAVAEFFTGDSKKWTVAPYAPNKLVYRLLFAALQKATDALKVKGSEKP